MNKQKIRIGVTVTNLDRAISCYPVVSEQSSVVAIVKGSDLEVLVLVLIEFLVNQA